MYPQSTEVLLVSSEHPFEVAECVFPQVPTPLVVYN
jgi:hypothetical protein